MIRYYKLYPILIGGSTQEEEELRAARNRMVLAMLDHSRLGAQSVARVYRDRGLYPLYQSIAEQIPDAQLRADLQNWIDSPIQFNKPNDDVDAKKESAVYEKRSLWWQRKYDEIEYSDINVNLERQYPILTQLALDGVSNLYQLLGFFILCEYDVTKLVQYLNDYINTADRIYTRENFPDSLLSLLYTKATNPLLSNGLELTPEMIVHGRVPNDSIWKRFVQNLDENPLDYERVEKLGFKIIAQLFIMNGDSEELNEFLTDDFTPDQTDTLGIIDAFNNFIMFRARKIYWFNILFNKLHEQGVFRELIMILG